MLSIWLIRQVVSRIAPPTPTKGGSSSSTLVMTTSLTSLAICLPAVIKNVVLPQQFSSRADADVNIIYRKKSSGSGLSIKKRLP